MIQAAILTGDLIGSTRAGTQATGATLDLLRATAGEVAAWSGWPARFSRFRGDGWQCAAALPHGPRAALYIAARCHGAGLVPSRIALGLGGVETWGTELSAARGPALVASGHALDAMGDETLVLAPDGAEPRDLGLMALMAALARRWSPAQAEALACALPPGAPPQREIARALGISAQAASQRLRGAEAPALLAALAAWETALQPREAP